MPLSIDALFFSPDHYLHSLDGDDAVFVPMDAAAYRRSIFLDDRIDPARPGAMRVPLRILLDNPPAAPAPVSWIFHVAHCGSTLLARALGDLGGTMVLREPLALRQAALLRDPAVLTLVLRMLGKRYGEGCPPVVKANVPVNFAIPQITAAMTDVAAVFLYYKLEDYALAILRSDNHRAWLGRISTELTPFITSEHPVRCDGERVAALWIAQLRQFEAGLEAWPGARSLDAEAFFARPADALSACARLFAVPSEPQAIERIIAGPLFSTYAKKPSVAFTNADRTARREALLSALAPEVDAARTWIAHFAPDSANVVQEITARSLR